MKSAGIVAAAALVGAANAWALSDYRCTVERTVSASENSYSHIYVGKQFTVERTTGVMAGALKNSYVTEPQVIDYGSSENSYKVVSMLRREMGDVGGSNVYALTINEHKDGARKPFAFLSNDDVYLGWCEHF
ncbi:hypothetical protein JET76_08125 [Pseudomonas putida]|uniref:hypothetical protein n=1 Tax=Pseudomonas putida TaxID=303 RepID=UPI0018E6705B|nr:hypothetical protein [Pseudomonas putida]MBI6941304.1 hypothetical protein [Pseudomonas putida]MBI6957675.1 hypothetical protein [Pseudomonas putida]